MNLRISLAKFYIQMAEKSSTDDILVNNLKNRQDQIVIILQDFARIARVRRDNAFKIRAFDNAAQSIDSLKDFDNLYYSGGLKKVPGIGKRILSIIDEIMQGKTLADFFPDFPLDILEMAEISAIGLKKATKLRSVGIRNIDELKSAAREGRLASVAGFGKAFLAKVNHLQKEPKKSRKFGEVRLEQALIMTDKIINKLDKNKQIGETLLIGDLRRGLEIVNSIDVLVIGKVLLCELEEMMAQLGVFQISPLRRLFSGKTGYISINDHSPSAFYAGGQSEENLINHLNIIAKLNRTELGRNCRVLSGTESDIRPDGSLDYDDGILKKLEIVVASVHSQLKMPSEKMTDRMVKAALNPFTTIIGHPTGRILFKRPGSTYEMEKLFEACKRNQVALELNCQPARLDLNDRYLSIAKEFGVLIAIDADAHSIKGFDFLRYGIIIARRAGLTTHDVLNALSLDDLKTWLTLIKRKDNT